MKVSLAFKKIWRVFHFGGSNPLLEFLLVKPEAHKRKTIRGWIKCWLIIILPSRLIGWADQESKPVQDMWK